MSQGCGHVSQAVGKLSRSIDVLQHGQTLAQKVGSDMLRGQRAREYEVNTQDILL